MPASSMCLIDLFRYPDMNLLSRYVNWKDNFSVTILAVLTAILAISTWREQLVTPRRWGRLALLAVLACGIAAVYIEQASVGVVMLIPTSYGGARAPLVRLVTGPEIGKLLRAAGVQFSELNDPIKKDLLDAGLVATDQKYAVTQPMELADETESGITVILSMPDPQTKRTYSSSLNLQKSELIAIMNEPTLASQVEKEHWDNPSVWPPQ